MERGRAEKIEAEIRNAVEGGIVPCVVLGLIEKEDRHVFAYGHSRLFPEKTGVRRETLFDLASLTKVVGTTTVILRLLREDRFTLKTPVSELLKRYRHPGTRVVDLLSHTSGLPHLAWQDLHSAEELIDRIYNADLLFEDRSRCDYCDTNFMLLGLVADAVAGGLQPCCDDLFERLGMRSTQFNPPEAKTSTCAATERRSDRGLVQGCVHDGKAYLLGGVAGHAGLFSDIDDLLTFAEFMLSKGRRPPGVLDDEAFALLSRNFTPGLGEDRTLGWRLRDGKCLYHTGFTGTSMLLDMEENRACIVLANRIHPSREDRGFFDFRDKVNSIFLHNDIPCA